MNKNIIYFLIVVALAIIAWVFIFNKDTGSFKGNDKAFGVKDTADIHRIFLADLSGTSIDVKREGDHWVVNDGVPARQDIINTLMTTFREIEVNVPVAKSMYEKVVRDIAGNHIKVEIYDKGNKKIRSFFIGPVSTAYSGNFMLVEGSKSPFIVHIPGFDGFISSRFVMEERLWKDRSVFNDGFDNIQELSINYPRVTDSSFTLIRQNDGTFHFESQTAMNGSVNPEIVKYYLNQYKSLNCETFVNDKYRLDSLLSEAAVCELILTDMGGVTRKANVYYRPTTYRTKMQFTYEGDEIQFDLDKYYCVLNNNQDLAIIQNFVFGKLFVGPSYFYRQKPSNINVLIDDIMKGAKGTTIDLMK